MAEIIEQNRIPKRTLVDGFKVPAIGLGTFGSDKYNSDQIAELYMAASGQDIV